MHFQCTSGIITMHTYIHNWPLQLFSQDYDLISHTTYVVCVNFIHKWQVTYSLKSLPKGRYLRNLSWQFIFTHSGFARNLLRASRRSNIFHISFFRKCLNNNLTSLISQHTTYYTMATLFYSLLLLCSTNSHDCIPHYFMCHCFQLI